MPNDGEYQHQFSRTFPAMWTIDVRFMSAEILRNNPQPLHSWSFSSKQIGCPNATYRVAVQKSTSLEYGSEPPEMVAKPLEKGWGDIAIREKCCLDHAAIHGFGRASCVMCGDEKCNWAFLACACFLTIKMLSLRSGWCHDQMRLPWNLRSTVTKCVKWDTTAILSKIKWPNLPLISHKWDAYRTECLFTNAFVVSAVNYCKLY